jgi:hypothetical protein
MKTCLPPTAPLGALEIGSGGLLGRLLVVQGRVPWNAGDGIVFEVLVVVLLFTGALFRLACLTSLQILGSSIMIYSHYGFYFPDGGIELPIFWTSAQASMVPIRPGVLTVEASIPPLHRQQRLIDWLLLYPSRRNSKWQSNST